jgi:DNA-binding CsgD family transcriptional regulator
MIATTLLLIWKLILPLLLVVAVIDWLTASDDRRVRILRRTGLSQRQIADRLHITRYRVRVALAS